METSIFTYKSVIPTDSDLQAGIGNTYEIWQSIHKYVIKKYPKAIAEWNFPGVKYGWNFKIKDKKRAIIYLLPRNMYFKVAFVFGQKATDAIMQSNVNQLIKTELANARIYAEGRGIRLNITNTELIPDIEMLVNIKLSY